MRRRTEVHEEGLEEAVHHVLEEGRTLMPGIQALFGFQLIAVFNSTFADRLTKGQQLLHLIAIALIAIAAALVMTPVAYHRQAEPRTVSDRFVRLATTMLTLALVPVCAGICIDFYLIALLVLGDTALSALAMGALALVFVLLWFVLPRAHRRRRA